MGFPGETLVTTKGGVKRLDGITPGEEILTLCRKSGKPIWTKFYSSGHLDPCTVAEFIVLQLSNGTTLKVSEEHLIFVEGTKGRKSIQTVASVCKGDKLFVGGFDSGIKRLSVAEISGETLTGIYAPFTISGHFLANGIWMGCYVDVGRNFDEAHAGFAHLRAGHEIRKTATESDANKERIHALLMKLRKSLPSFSRSPWFYVLSHI